MLGQEGQWRGYAEGVCLIGWKLDPAEIALPLIIVLSKYTLSYQLSCYINPHPGM